MSHAGFVYTPQTKGDDTATCLYCKVSLSGWDDDDDPMYVHEFSLDRYKVTPTALGWSTRNAPLNLASNARFLVHQAAKYLSRRKSRLFRPMPPLHSTPRPGRRELFHERGRSKWKLTFRPIPTEIPTPVMSLRSQRLLRRCEHLKLGERGVWRPRLGHHPRPQRLARSSRQYRSQHGQKCLSQHWQDPPNQPSPIYLRLS